MAIFQSNIFFVPANFSYLKHISDNMLFLKWKYTPYFYEKGGFGEGYDWKRENTPIVKNEKKKFRPTSWDKNWFYYKKKSDVIWKNS